MIVSIAVEVPDQVESELEGIAGPRAVLDRLSIAIDESKRIGAPVEEQIESATKASRICREIPPRYWVIRSAKVVVQPTLRIEHLPREPEVVRDLDAVSVGIRVHRREPEGLIACPPHDLRLARRRRRIRHRKRRPEMIPVHPVEGG
jgi:hypothetical protein